MEMGNNGKRKTCTILTMKCTVIGFYLGSMDILKLYAKVWDFYAFVDIYRKDLSIGFVSLPKV